MLKKLIPILLISVILPIQNARAEVESWYTYWALGFADVDYPGDLNSALEQVDALPGISRYTIGMDLFGFYWPLADQKTMMGFVVNVVSDTLDDEIYNESFSIDSYLYGLSAMKFFGSEVGDGFLLRGDIGLTFAELSYTYGNTTTTDTSDTGLGYLIGVGYGIPVSGDSRIILSLNYSSRDIEGDDINNIVFTVGGLW